MKLLILLSTGLLLAAANPNETDSSLDESELVSSTSAELSSDDDPIFQIVHIANRVKNLLSRGAKSYRISWDDSLALGAAERIESCPEKALKSGEFFSKLERIRNLEMQLQLQSPEVSLNVFPTVTTLQKRTVRVDLQIGSRMGCAFKQCSERYDLICHFESRKNTQRRLDRQNCELDAEFQELCVEKPIDYSLLEAEEFENRMMTWNEHRRTFANRFNVSRMYELRWSDSRAATAKAHGPDLCRESPVGPLFYAHPRDFEPARIDNVLKREISTGLATRIAMLFPELRSFGCAPMDADSCPQYSYFCAIDHSWINSDKEPARGVVCSNCDGECVEGLCRTTEEIEEKSPVDKPPVKLLVVGPAILTAQTTTESAGVGLGALLGLAASLLICSGLAVFLLCILVSRNYEN